jgi:hypothetical protein
VVNNSLCILEILSDIFAQGGVSSAYKRVFRIWPETICQLLNIFGVIRIFQNEGVIDREFETTKIFELIVFIRLLKMISLLYEVRSFRIILETLRIMLVPVSSLLIITIMIMFEFGLLGMYMFGGKVQTTDEVFTQD